MNRANRAAITSYDNIKLNEDSYPRSLLRPDCTCIFGKQLGGHQRVAGLVRLVSVLCPTQPFFDKSWQSPDFELV